MEPHAALGPLLPRLTQAWGLGLAARRQGASACPQRARRARCARRDSAAEPRDTCPRPEGQRALEALGGAWSPWRWPTAAVDDPQAPPVGPGSPGGPGAPLPQPGLDPRTTGAPARRHRVVGERLIQGRTGACHLAHGVVPATR